MSVVIATSTAGPRLHALMERLYSGGPVQGDVEFVIAVSDTAAAVERARACCRRFDERFVRVAPVPDASVPALYAAGLRVARGRCVAMTNDRFLPSPEWLSAVSRRAKGLAQASATVVAGAIDPPTSASLVDRTVYYMEYGAFALSPANAGDAGRLSGAAGANVVYSGAALDLLRPLTVPPAWEYFWHEALVARGATLAPDATIGVRMVYGWTLSEAWRERYHYARAFAAERARHLGRGVRVVRGLAALVLPPVLFIRMCRHHGRHGWPFISTLPVVGILTMPWAWGEAMGTWAGPGDSLGRVTLG